MTNSTTKDQPSQLTVAAGGEPVARKTQPGIAVPPAAPESDLESRIKQRRAELIGKLGELKADTRLAATEARDKLKARLSELAHIIKLGVIDSWASVGDAAKHKLEDWLAQTDRPGSSHGVSAGNEPS